jgi:hypothetical protein
VFMRAWLKAIASVLTHRERADLGQRIYARASK